MVDDFVEKWNPNTKRLKKNHIVFIWWEAKVNELSIRGWKQPNLALTQYARECIYTLGRWYNVYAVWFGVVQCKSIARITSINRKHLNIKLKKYGEPETAKANSKSRVKQWDWLYICWVRFNFALLFYQNKHNRFKAKFKWDSALRRGIAWKRKSNKNYKNWTQSQHNSFIRIYAFN